MWNEPNLFNQQTIKLKEHQIFNKQSHWLVITAEDSLVVAEVNDLQLLHVAHLLRQRLQLIGVQEQHSGVLPVPHLKESEGETEQTGSQRLSSIRSNPCCRSVHSTCTLTSGGSWTRKLWSAAKVRMQAHWPMEEGNASISLKLQSSSSSTVSLQQGGAHELVCWAYAQWKPLAIDTMNNVHILCSIVDSCDAALNHHLSP